MRRYLLALAALSLTLLVSCKHSNEDVEEHNKDHDNYAAEHNLNSANEAPVFHSSHLESRQNTPFSDAVQVGNTFYLAGQIGRDHNAGALVEGGIQAETRQTLENIKAVLEHHDMTMANVVKALVILDDIEDFAAFNEIYTTYLPQRPARTTFAAESLAAGAKIEIEVIAVKHD